MVYKSQFLLSGGRPILAHLQCRSTNPSLAPSLCERSKSHHAGSRTVAVSTKPQRVLSFTFGRLLPLPGYVVPLMS